MTPPPLAPPCRACGTPRAGPHCHACGQAVADEQPLTMRRLVRDYAERITSVDRPLVHTVRAMALGPGAVARRYLAGERHALLSPLATFALAVALYLATYVLYRDQAMAAALNLSADPLVFSPNDPAAAAMQAEIAAMTQAWTARLVANMKYVLLLGALPLALAFRWIMPRRYTTGEWFAATLYAFAFYTAVSAVVLPLLYLLPAPVAAPAATVATNLLLAGVVLWTTRTMMDHQPGTTLYTVFGIGLAMAGMSLLMIPVALMLAWQIVQHIGATASP